MIWSKTRAGNILNRKTMPGRAHEDIMVFQKAGNSAHYTPVPRTGFAPNTGPATRKKQMQGGNVYKHTKEETTYDDRGSTDRPPTSVLVSCSVPTRNSQHPTQKPVALLAYLIRTFCPDGGTVLDPTMGSGSTGVASLWTRRKFVGFERDTKFFGVAKTRLRDWRRAKF